MEIGMTPSLYLLMPLLLTSLVLTPTSHVSSMRNSTSHVVTPDLTSQLLPTQNWKRRLGQSFLRLNLLLVRTDLPGVHTATTVVVVVTLSIQEGDKEKIFPKTIVLLFTGSVLSPMLLISSDTFTFF